MARLKPSVGSPRSILSLSVWLYRLLLRVYPAAFRREYGERIVSVFRDSCQQMLQQHGLIALLPFWLQTMSDLFLNACLEHGSVLREKSRLMTPFHMRKHIPLRMGIALTATILAFVVSLVASLNLYLIEDSSPLTQIAYAASPLLRFSYDGIYLSALAAGVAVCAILGSALVSRAAFAIPGISVVALVVAAGGFGGLLIHYPITFLIDLCVFLALSLLSILMGRAIATRAERWLGQKPAAILGACASVCGVLLINVAALVLHTLLLNPVSHALFMQGQIEGTHLNFSLIAMILASFTLLACAASLGWALRAPPQQQG